MSFLDSDEDIDFDDSQLSILQETVYAQLHEEPEEENLFKGVGNIDKKVPLSEVQPLFIVIDYFIQGSEYSSNMTEIIVRLWQGVGYEERFVHLRDQWAYSKISVGDTAFVVGDWKIRDEPYGFYSHKLSCFVSDKDGFFILLPHVLIQGTRLASSQDCQRKAYLVDLLSMQQTNLEMVIGTIVHELIQYVLKGTLASDLDVTLENSLSTKQVDLYQIGQTSETIKPKLDIYLKEIRKIAELLEKGYQSSTPSSSLKSNSSSSLWHPIEESPPYGCETVNEEENIWSFQWRLKGKIDATLKHSSRLFPLEIKSGSSFQGGPRDSHVLQLASYMFMMKEKYKELSGKSGIIYYAKDSISFEISPGHKELMHIIMRRNTLSHAIAHGTLPATTAETRKCNYCNSKAACAFLESGEKVKSSINHHLMNFLPYEQKKQYLDFYRKWEKTLLDEMYITRASQTMIWLRSPDKRKSDGRALGPLNATRDILSHLELIASDASVITSSMIQLNDYVMLTKGGLPPIIGRGRIIEIKDNRITLEMYELTSTLKDIHIINDFDDLPVPVKSEERSNNDNDSYIDNNDNNDNDDNDDFASYKVAKDEIIATDLYIDKWETMSSVDICRRNLMSLFTGQVSVTGSRLIDLIIDYRKPIFSELTPKQKLWYDPCLNDDQNNAIKMAISAKDYILLLGMPGTGKTTALVSLIKRLVDEGNRVLVASYTHTAVDNICLKMNDSQINYIRFSRQESIHKEVLNNSIESIIGDDATATDIGNALDSCQVFATTCLGVDNPLIDMQSQPGKLFDVCVIDEASQISLPTVLGPISRSKSFILVGDHYQLPPITRYASGKGEESPPSLFRLLSEASPEAIVTLRTQYRMNDEILSLCNKLVYGFRMRTGLSTVGEKRMRLTRLKLLSKFDPFHTEWIQISVQPDPSIVFYNTDEVPMLEMKGKGSKHNEKEAATVSMIVSALIICVLQPENIGVISLYRTQVNFIRKSISKQLLAVQRFFPNEINDVKVLTEKLEVHTVDKFQGRDKECIIFSAVKSNSKCSPGTHITDWQRLNVAVTRAKTKFILIGSKKTLNNSPFFSKMFDIIDEKCIFNLPNEIDEVDAKPFCSMTQIVSLADTDSQI